MIINVKRRSRPVPNKDECPVSNENFRDYFFLVQTPSMTTLEQFWILLVYLNLVLLTVADYIEV